VKLCGTYAPLIYSASLTYNPLDIQTINITEKLEKIKNEKRTGNEVNSQTNDTEGTTTNNNSSSGTSETRGDSNSSSYNNASSLNVASDTPQRTDFKTTNTSAEIMLLLLRLMNQNQKYKILHIQLLLIAYLIQKEKHKMKHFLKV